MRWYAAFSHRRLLLCNCIGIADFLRSRNTIFDRISPFLHGQKSSEAARCLCCSGLYFTEFPVLPLGYLQHDAERDAVLSFPLTR